MWTRRSSAGRELPFRHSHQSMFSTTLSTQACLSQSARTISSLSPSLSHSRWAGSPKQRFLASQSLQQYPSPFPITLPTFPPTSKLRSYPKTFTYSTPTYPLQPSQKVALPSQPLISWIPHQFVVSSTWNYLACQTLPTSFRPIYPLPPSECCRTPRILPAFSSWTPASQSLNPYRWKFSQSTIPLWLFRTPRVHPEMLPHPSPPPQTFCFPYCKFHFIAFVYNQHFHHGLLLGQPSI